MNFNTDLFRNFPVHPSNLSTVPHSLPSTLPPMIMAAPIGYVPPPPKPVLSPDHELKWSDLDESDIRRFQLEEKGRCYASHYPYDLILDVYRSVYMSYPEDVRHGPNPIPEDHHSGIFQRDVISAEKQAYSKDD